jgi:hypothetical protein
VPIWKAFYNTVKPRQGDFCHAVGNSGNSSNNRVIKTTIFSMVISTWKILRVQWQNFL